MVQAGSRIAVSSSLGLEVSYNFYCGQISYGQYVNHPRLLARLLATRTHCRGRGWAHVSLILHELPLEPVAIVMVMVMVMVRDMGMGMGMGEMHHVSRVTASVETALSAIRASAFVRS